MIIELLKVTIPENGIVYGVRGFEAICFNTYDQAKEYFDKRVEEGKSGNPFVETIEIFIVSETK